MEVDRKGRRIPQTVPCIKFLPGATNFYWNEERLMCYIILVSIVIGYSIFMINDAPFLAEKWTFLVPLLASVIFLSTVVNQLLAAFTNPGIIEAEDFKNALEPPASVVMNKTQNERELLVEVEIEAGGTMSLKYCKTCKIIRPKEASHCQYCDFCVYRSDHHCPYLGNCIGLKNHGNFYLFLLSVVLLTIIGFCLSLVHILHYKDGFESWKEALEMSKWSIVVCLGCILGCPFPFGLLCFQTYILMSDQTSRIVCKALSEESNDSDTTSTHPESKPRLISICNCITRLFQTSKAESNFELKSYHKRSQTL